MALITWVIQGAGWWCQGHHPVSLLLEGGRNPVPDLLNCGLTLWENRHFTGLA